MAYYVAGDSKLEDAVSYIFEHSYLQAFNYNQNVLDLTFRVPLSQWDTDLADTILRGLKQDSSRYEIDRAYISDIEKFLQNVIIDQKAKYWLIARFNIDLNNFNWQGIKYYWNNHNFYPDDLVVAKAGLNPHLEYFTCVGSYRAQIEGAKQRKDLPGMIESLLAPYKNLQRDWIDGEDSREWHLVKNQCLANFNIDKKFDESLLRCNPMLIDCFSQFSKNKNYSF